MSSSNATAVLPLLHDYYLKDSKLDPGLCFIQITRLFYNANDHVLWKLDLELSVMIMLMSEAVVNGLINLTESIVASGDDDGCIKLYAPTTLAPGHDFWCSATHLFWRTVT